MHRLQSGGCKGLSEEAVTPAHSPRGRAALNRSWQGEQGEASPRVPDGGESAE